MEVKNVLYEPAVLTRTDKNEAETMKNTSFQALLEGVSRQYPDGPQTVSSSSGLEGVLEGPLPPVAPLHFLSGLDDPARIRSQGIEMAGKTLDLLEEYQKAMANPNLSLKQIYPLVQTLSQELQGLNALSEKLPSSDPLQPILTHAGIVSAVEIEKFHRGEYV